MTKLKIACDYLNADMDGHLKVHGKWRLDPGKLQAAIDTAGLTTATPDLLAACKAVLDLVESEGRDTGMGGPFSDMRDAIESE